MTMFNRSVLQKDVGPMDNGAASLPWKKEPSGTSADPGRTGTGDSREVMGEYTSKDVPEPEGDSTIPSTRRGTRPTHPLSSATPTSKYSRRAAQN